MADDKIEQLLLRIAEAQEKHTAISESVKNDLVEVKESIRRIHSRLDETARETTVNSETIKHLKENIVKCEITCKSENVRLWKGLKEGDENSQKSVMLKLYGSILASISALVVALIVAFAKFKG